MGKIMKNFRTRKWLKGLILVALLFTGCMFLSNSTTDVQAATAGFKTIGGKTYYIKSDGSKQKGWLTLGNISIISIKQPVFRSRVGLVYLEKRPIILQAKKEPW